MFVNETPAWGLIYEHWLTLTLTWGGPGGILYIKQANLHGNFCLFIYLFKYRK